MKSGRVIKSVAVSADLKTATITVEGTLANNKVDALTVSNVKAGDKVVSVKNLEFTTVDNTIPTVESIKGLGTKSVKVVFSEPVNDLKQSNFNLDGKEYFGKVTLGANNRSVILTPFSSSALAVGDHKLTVSGVKDFANFVSLSSVHEFTVIEDKDAPTVTESKATLETVTLTFSEDVDKDTVSASKVYWKSGNDKKTAVDFEQVTDNQYKFNFGTTKSLPTGSVVLYVEGVKDYSGNEIAKDTTVIVTPEIDQVRPEVKKVAAVDARTIKVNVSKAILPASATDTKNYVVLNKDNKVVSVQSANFDTTDKTNKTIIVKLYSDLSTGDNAITIKNLKDATKLQNTMLDYTSTVSLGDKTAPTIDSTVVNTKDRRVVINFSEKMDPESLASYSNYLVTIDNKQQGLTPDIADITVLQDGSVVVITFAEALGGKYVKLAPVSTSNVNTYVSSINILSVKDAAGNLLKEFSDAKGNNVVVVTADTVTTLKDFDGDHAGKKAKLVDTKTVKVKFSAGIQANSGAFSYVVGGAEQVSYVDTDGTSVATVHFVNDLKTDARGLALNIDLSRIETVANEKAGTGIVSINSGNIIDAVAPVIVLPTNQESYSVAGNVITLPYSEALNLTGNTDYNAGTFEVIRTSDNKTLNPVGDYTVRTNPSDASIIEIILNDSNSRPDRTTYQVNVKDAKYITDSADNAVANSNGETVTVIGTAKPAAKGNAASFGVNDGSITDVNSTMEWKVKGGNYASVVGTSVSSLAPGTYYVRVKAVPAVPNVSAEVPAGAEAEVVITEAAPTAAEAVDADVDAFVTPVVVDATTNASLTLAAKGAYGSNITWVADSTTVSGVYSPVRPASGSTTVNLTATVSKGASSDLVKFTVTVPTTGAVVIAPVAP